MSIHDGNILKLSINGELFSLVREFIQALNERWMKREERKERKISLNSLILKREIFQEFLNAFTSESDLCYDFCSKLQSLKKQVKRFSKKTKSFKELYFKKSKSYPKSNLLTWHFATYCISHKTRHNSFRRELSWRIVGTRLDETSRGFLMINQKLIKANAIILISIKNYVTIKWSTGTYKQKILCKVLVRSRGLHSLTCRENFPGSRKAPSFQSIQANITLDPSSYSRTSQTTQIFHILVSQNICRDPQRTENFTYWRLLKNMFNK